MSDSYINLPGMLPVEVRRSIDDRDSVTVEQRGVDEDDPSDLIFIHASQVPAVIKALQKFLKEIA